MRKQDQLNALISSMSKQEKRYFRLFASLQSGDKKFMQLFDLLTKAETYEPDALAKQLKVTKRNLVDIKGYLQQVVLNSLRLYEQDKDLTGHLLNQWQEARVLYRRNLREMAFTINEKVLEKAGAYEIFSVVHVALVLKYNLLILSGDVGETEDVARRLLLTTDQLRQTQELMALCQLFTETSSGFETKKELKDIARDPLFNKRPDELLSNSSRLVWHEMKQYYNYYVGPDPEAVIQHNKSKIDILDAHPELVYQWPTALLNSLSYLSITYADIGQYDEAMTYAKRLEYESDGHRTDISANVCAHYNIGALLSQQYLLCYMGKYEASLKTAQVLYTRKEKLKTDRLIHALHFYSIALFYTGNYQKTQKICEEIQALNTEAMKDYQLCSKILLVMVHHAQRNNSLLPYLLNSAATWNQRHQIKKPGTKELIQWIRRFAKDVEDGKQRIFFKEMKNAVEGDLFGNYTRDLSLDEWVRKNK